MEDCYRERKNEKNTDQQQHIQGGAKICDKGSSQEHANTGAVCDTKGKGEGNSEDGNTDTEGQEKE